ncbi:MAG TPA: BACON domain-containing carbohydrate-binding protein [Acidobacteriota bacterium]
MNHAPFNHRFGWQLSITLSLFLSLNRGAEAHCPNDVSPASMNFGAEGGAGTMEIKTDPGCPWTVISSAPWLTLTSAPSGFGAAKVNFSVARNSSVEKRTATLSVTGNLFTVIQSGVAATVSDLSLTKKHGGYFTVGLNGTYRLTVSSIGSAATVGLITVTDALPPGLTFVSASGVGWACSGSDSTVSCTKSDSLPPGTDSSIVITVSVSRAAVPGVINSAKVSNANDAFPENNIAADPTLVFSGEVLPLTSGTPMTGTVPADTVGVFPCRFSQPQYSIDVPSGALQLIIALNSDQGPELLVSYAQPVAETEDPSASFSAKSPVPSKAVYIGPQSNPALLAGTYFVSVANCTTAQSNFTVTATVVTPSSPVKTEELAIDDGSRETGLLGDGMWAVNRLRPPRYPSKLKAIRIFFTQFEVYPDPLGQQVRLVVFSDPTGSNRPPNSPVLLVDEVVTIPGKDEFIDFPLENGPTIFSGDWYVGLQQPKPFNGALVSADSIGVQNQASFYSIDDGKTFQGPAFTPAQPMNFMIRAVVESGPQRARRRP